jgi:acetyl-CoA C-acetyltransferase
MKEIVIVDAARTAIGSFGGTLSQIPAHKLGSAVIKGLLDRTGVKAEMIDEVILGQVLTAGAGQNPARQAAIDAGLPYETSSMTINKVCGSGLKAVHLAMQSILCGDSEIVIAGGQENMSASPHILPGSRAGQKMGEWSMVDTMIVDGLWDAFNDYHMGATAENIAEKFCISREMQDEFAVQSQQKAEIALNNEVFEPEIVPVEVPQRKKDPIIFKKDEFPRAGTSLASLSKLWPVFNKDGSVTAGNASGINDGAAAVLVMSAEKAKELNLKPLVKIAAFASSGVDPSIMGTGPIPASTKCLKKAGWSVNELERIESNEAFAAQAICVNQEMGWDTGNVNVNGGAIALGHPIGASGCRVLVTLIHEMQRSGKKRGLATLCIGGGQGVAMAVEQV